MTEGRLADLRRGFAATVATLPPGPAVGSVEHATLETGATVRIYRNPGVGQPLLVWFHGGGWVVGDLDSSDATCRRLANGAGCVVISVDYRLAPEHPFPAAYQDALAALRWAAGEATALGGDPSKLMVGGASAGGNLAFAATVALRTEETRPRLQLLVYPITEVVFDDLPTTAGPGLDAAQLCWYRDQYVNGGVDRADPAVSPARASNLGALPPTVILCGSDDVLVGQARSLGRQLAAADVDVAVLELPGERHGFLTVSTSTASDRAHRLLVGVIRSEFDHDEVDPSHSKESST